MSEIREAAVPRAVPSGTSSLRFPKLFALVLLLFLLDLIVPDFIPMADEMILGVLSLMLGILRKPRETPPAD